jgi:hypothetical protein
LGIGIWDFQGAALARHRFCFVEGAMQATFFQKVILCAIAGFLAAALLQWGKMFVTGADDALNKGYKSTAPAKP